MSFEVVESFVQVFNDMFSFIGLDHKFMTEVPESSLNSTEKVNMLIGITGDYEGNIMFSYTFKTAKEISAKLMGVESVSEVDEFVKAALADFYSEFCKRFINSVKIANMYEENYDENSYTLLAADPTYVAGEDMYGVISKVPAKKVFFKVNGDKFGIAYSLAKK